MLPTRGIEPRLTGDDESRPAAELQAAAAMAASRFWVGSDQDRARPDLGGAVEVEDKVGQALARGIGARCDGDGRGGGCSARLELKEEEEARGNTTTPPGQGRQIRSRNEVRRR